MSLVIVNTPCTANSQQVLSKLQLDSNPHTLHDIERQSLGDHGTPTSDSGTLIDTFKELPMSSDTIEVPSLTKISNYDVPSPSIKPNREKVKEPITFYIKPDRVVTKVFQGIDHEDVIEEHFETSITGSPSQFGDKDCRPTVFKNECILTRATSDNIWQPTNRRQLRRNETVIHSFMEKETFSPLIRRSASLNQVPSIEVNNVFALLPRKSNLPGDENKNKDNEEVNMTSDMDGQYADLEGRDEDTCADIREPFVRKEERKNSRIKNLDELPNYLIPLVFRSVNPFENPVAYQTLQKKNEKSPEKVHYSEKSTKKKKGGEVTSCGEILSEDSDMSP